MNKRRISIEDIAQRAGISHSTVSRALRDNALISPKVREKIKQLAQETNYVPNAIAQSLQTAKRVDHFKENSPFMPTDETFVEFQLSTINVLFKDILKLKKTSFLKL